MSPEGSPDSPTWGQRSTQPENELWSWSSGLAYNPLPFKEKDVSSSPKFTAPLVDRSVVAGYATAISCAVRGHPKVGNIPWSLYPGFVSRDGRKASLIIDPLPSRSVSKVNGGAFQQAPLHQYSELSSGVKFFCRAGRLIPSADRSCALV